MCVSGLQEAALTSRSVVGVHPSNRTEARCAVSPVRSQEVSVADELHAFRIPSRLRGPSLLRDRYGSGDGSCPVPRPLPLRPPVRPGTQLPIHWRSNGSAVQSCPMRMPKPWHSVSRPHPVRRCQGALQLMSVTGCLIVRHRDPGLHQKSLSGQDRHLLLLRRPPILTDTRARSQTVYLFGGEATPPMEIELALRHVLPGRIRSGTARDHRCRRVSRVISSPALQIPHGYRDLHGSGEALLWHRAPSTSPRYGPAHRAPCSGGHSDRRPDHTPSVSNSERTTTQPKGVTIGCQPPLTYAPYSF
ncbi:hypothetical protein NDU88_004155 [Pleurodeles waltl]|uniref:Uncharacterized protein n=1 Tax=Pleurodeles waltl TaxID=8319 RepID=A0AAV7MSN8_PLEWA|nr:hypothetical protein NDU88_004155 [Pleurodeles waltl]